MNKEKLKEHVLRRALFYNVFTESGHVTGVSNYDDALRISENLKRRGRTAFIIPVYRSLHPASPSELYSSGPYPPGTSSRRIADAVEERYGLDPGSVILPF